MNGRRSMPLPLGPLLRAFDHLRPVDMTAVPLLGRRFAALVLARTRLITEAFLDSASADEFAWELGRFYEAVVGLPLHRETLIRRAARVRFGLDHLVRCPDPLPVKVDRALTPAGAYRVAGLGPSFWSALAQAIDPRAPSWLPTTLAGWRRLQRLDPGETSYARLTEAYAAIYEQRPDWSGADLDLFLSAVAALEGRDLGVALARLRDGSADAPVGPALVRARAEQPLRRRLKEFGERYASARHQLETGLHDGHAGKIVAALALVGQPVGAVADSDAQTLALWVGRAWESDTPAELLARFWSESPLPDAGPGLLPAVLHLRDPARFPPWTEPARRGFARLDETCDPGLISAEAYRLYAEGVDQLRQRFQLHACEVPDLLGSLADADETEPEPAFGGFGADSFAFFAELARANNREWMDQQRERYLFAVRQPMVELCTALAERYVGPVLGPLHGWRFETTPHPSRCFSSISRNDYGRSVPYECSLWFAFYRADAGSKRDDLQLFVRLEATGLSFGLYIGRRAAAVGDQLRANIERHGPALLDELRRRGTVSACRFTHAPGPSAVGVPLDSLADLKRWASGRVLAVSHSLPPDSPLTRREGLVGEILLTFDRLLPLLACAYEEDASPWLRPPGEAPPGPVYTEADFHRETHLSGDWLRRARTLLELKRQLILQGVPGTGKTHVARGLARLLTRGRDDTIRLVQFHPNYSYEEFVEGIKPRSVEVDGRREMSYPVETGLLCRFAAEAAARPSEPHVLLIDEINRGNLPRVFGELLYLLEYRDQAVGLPYSGRGFCLPPNLYLIGTMNAGDRSALLLDQALRRRFSFLEMPPDPGVLAAWLNKHPPPSGDEFAQTIVALFEGLNLRLRNELGPTQQVGHSYFMVPDLDEDRLRVVWEHQVRPLLADYFAMQPQRLADYELDRLMGRRPARRK